MHQSRVEVFVHVVWATHVRMPLITTDIERAIYRSISSQVCKLDCSVVALGGTEDHIHLLVKMGPTVDLARLVNQVKGVSSYLVKQEFAEHSGFAWQEGYGAFSVTPNQIPKVLDYVRNQKQHHALGMVQHAWEPEQPKQAVNSLP